MSVVALFRVRMPGVRPIVKWGVLWSFLFFLTVVLGSAIREIYLTSGEDNWRLGLQSFGVEVSHGFCNLAQKAQSFGEQEAASSRSFSSQPKKHQKKN